MSTEEPTIVSITTPCPPHQRLARAELPLGAIRPAGWLLNQLRVQAAGLTRLLPDVWPDVGPASAWLGGDGEDWERGPYYLDGLLPLAHLVEDKELLARASIWVEAILSGQRADGWFGPPSNDDWWPRMVAAKVLIQHADATGDPRVPEFLSRYYRYQFDQLPHRPLHTWGQARGADNILGVLWLHHRTGEPWLLELAELILVQTLDWEDYLTGHLITGRAVGFDHFTHGPNVAMGLKTPALAYLLDGDRSHQRKLFAALGNLDRYHGLANGMFSGDEWLAGREPHHGVETCQVVEYMYTLEQLVRIFGDGTFADLLELAAFNALPASCDAEMTAHQYHQQVNQVLVSVAPRDWSFSGDDANLFGLEPHFGCCTANYHQGWPKFVRSLWMSTPDGGLAAVSYAPCTVSAEAGGTTVRLDVASNYPFTECVDITVTPAEPTSFPLLLRIPGWCQAPEIEVAGAAVLLDPDESGHVRIERQWQPGDTVRLTLPMPPRILPRDRAAVSIAVGPLIMAHRIAAIWQRIPGSSGFGDWEVRPRKSWNFGLLTTESRSWRVERAPVPDVPFAEQAQAVRLRVAGARIPQWTTERNSAGPLPHSPVATAYPAEEIMLVPYGAARLRVTEFPVVAAPEVHEIGHS